MRVEVHFKLLKKLACLALVLFPFYGSKAQSPFTGLEPLFTGPRNYTTCFTDSAPTIDGDITDAVWQAARWSENFIDIEGDAKPKPALDTRVKMLWDNTHLYIAAELKEPHVWATLKHRDEVVFHDNDFEVFISPENSTHQYYEVEVNALNTVFDLFLPKPYRNGGGAMIAWNLDKLQSAVQVQGTLNDPRDTDKGWTVEMAIPFRSVTIGNETKVPAEGTLWRINFSRVQWDTEIKGGNYVKRKGSNGRPLPEHNWVWSPQGVINMHYPERWGYLQFTRRKAENNATPFSLPYAEKQKSYLWLVYYRQKEHYQKHKRYAADLKELGIEDDLPVMIGERENQLQLEATTRQFMATIQDTGNSVWSIDQNGLIQKMRNTL